MAILREPKIWRRQRRPKAFQLTDAERVNVQAALRSATSAYGSFRALQRKMGVSPDVLRRAKRNKGSVGAGFALALARALATSIEALLAGNAGERCPQCGRA